MAKRVAKRLEKLQRDFLWRWGRLEREVHLINWEVVCTQKEKGGLGIRKIDPLNKALLDKWIWRIAFEKDNLWKMVIGVKYGKEEFGWRTKEARGTYGVGVWKKIMEAKWCWDSIKFKVGKGTRVKFWTDQCVATRRCPKLSLNFLPWRSIGMQRLMRCGTQALVKEVGILDFIEILMIGSWT